MSRKCISATGLLLVIFALASRAEEQLNTLSDAEKAAGWKLLFDGKTLDGWHSFKQKEASSTWSAKEGAMVLTPVKNKHNPGLVTNDAFENFELSIDWKISPAGNSGIFYRVLDEGSDLNWTGVEYQVI